MLTLAFDTSTSVGSVVLFENNKIFFEKTWVKGHSEMLTSTIEEALRVSSKKPQEIKRLFVGIGPGSFTGIRVSVNVARTLAYSLGLKVHCFDSFELLVLGVEPSATSQKYLLGLIDAFNNQLFSARFEKKDSRWIRVTESRSETIDELSSSIKVPHLCLGEAYDQYEPHFSPELKKLLIRDTKLSQSPNVSSIVRKPDFGLKPLAWNEVQALYIKASAAEEKLRDQ